MIWKIFRILWQISHAFWVNQNFFKAGRLYQLHRVEGTNCGIENVVVSAWPWPPGAACKPNHNESFGLPRLPFSSLHIWHVRSDIFSFSCRKIGLQYFYFLWIWGILYILVCCPLLKFFGHLKHYFFFGGTRFYMYLKKAYYYTVLICIVFALFSWSVQFWVSFNLPELL